MEEMAKGGDARAVAFLAAMAEEPAPGLKDSPRRRKGKAASLVRAIARVDTAKVGRQERRGLDVIKSYLMDMRGEGCEVCATMMPDVARQALSRILSALQGRVSG